MKKSWTSTYNIKMTYSKRKPETDNRRLDGVSLDFYIKAEDIIRRLGEEETRMHNSPYTVGALHEELDIISLYVARMAHELKIIKSEKEDEERERKIDLSKKSSYLEGLAAKLGRNEDEIYEWDGDTENGYKERADDLRLRMVEALHDKESSNREGAYLRKLIGLFSKEP